MRCLGVIPGVHQISVGLSSQVGSKSGVPNQSEESFLELRGAAIQQTVRQMLDGVLECFRTMAEDGYPVPGILNVFPIGPALGEVVDLQVGDTRIQGPHKALIGLEGAAWCVLDLQIMVSKYLRDSGSGHQTKDEIATE